MLVIIIACKVNASRSTKLIKFFKFPDSNISKRLTMLSGGESLDDPNWDSKLAEILGTKFNSVMELVAENYGKGRKEINNTDKLVESKSNSLIKEITHLMEETLYRSAIQKIFYEYWKLVKDYLATTEFSPNKKSFEELTENYLIMLKKEYCIRIHSGNII